MRIRLNPCDYLYFVHDRHVRHTGVGGGVGFLIVEVAGHANPEQVCSVFCQTMAAHPFVLGRLRIGRVLGRPYWQLPNNPTQAAFHAAQKAFLHEDLRNSVDADSILASLLDQRFQPAWAHFPDSQIRIEQYSLPGERTWFCLRWPHMLMDAGGGQWFLSEMGRFSAAASQKDDEKYGPDDQLAPDNETLDPLAGLSFFARLKLFRQGLALSSEYRGLRISALSPDPPPKVTSQGLIRRTWPADMVRKMRANADANAPAGPARHARFLGACVIRALHSIYSSRGIEVDAYPISLPLSMTEGDPSSTDEASSASPRRPMPGNYLVAPTLYGLRTMADDHAALGEDLLRQLNEYFAVQGPLKQWAMIWLASKMRVWMYEIVYRRRIGVDTLVSGFSYYGQIARPVRRICGTKVTNLWGTAPLSTPPGWNPIFNKHQGKLNLALAYNRPAISDQLAEQFVSLIEREVFA